MSCHDTKYCPRCQNGFECKPGNIVQCQCYGITLNEQEKAALAANYTDCLCRACLLEIKQQVKHRPTAEALKKMEGLLKSR